MCAQASEAKLAKDATFVFEGTVQQLGRATMPSVPVNDQTAVVRVDHVRRAPEALTGLAGHDVTVQLRPAEKVAPGERAVFYTTGWLFGESVAVQALGHTPVRDAAASIAATVDRALEAHLADADLVVTGTVTSVQLPAGSGGAQPVAPVSEHAALWRDAVVDVEHVGKGQPALKRVIVRFPSSTDVRWASVPKLHAGQGGVFLLHRSEPAASRRPVYTVLHREDVQPPPRAEEIHALLEAARRKPRR